MRDGGGKNQNKLTLNLINHDISKKSFLAKNYWQKYWEKVSIGTINWDPLRQTM